MFKTRSVGLANRQKRCQKVGLLTRHLTSLGNRFDTICRPGKPTDKLSKSRTADPTFNQLGEPVQDTICRPGNPTDTLLESRTAEQTDDDILFLSEKRDTVPTFN